jgi:hypothetical protein
MRIRMITRRFGTAEDVMTVEYKCVSGAIGLIGIILATVQSPVGAQSISPVVRVSVSSSGEQGNGASHQLGTGRDFRYVLFRSMASNLVASDTNGVEDLFIRDRDTDGDGVFDEPGAVSTLRVSVGSQGQQADRPTESGSLSRDGRFVLFTTDAGTLTPSDTNQLADIFLRDRDTDADGVFDEPDAATTTRISEGTGGLQADAASAEPVMTPDGRFVLFISAASTLSTLPSGGVKQIYRKDRHTGTLMLVSQAPTGGPGDAASDMPSMSDDGQLIAFRSEAGNLGGGPAGVSRMYVRDLAAGTMFHFAAPPTMLPTLGPPTVLGTPGVAPGGESVFFSVWMGIYGGTASSYTRGELYEVDRRTGTHRAVASGRSFTFANDPRYVVFSGHNHLILSCGYKAGFHLLDRVTGAVTALVSSEIAAAAISGSRRRVLYVRPDLSDCPPIVSGPRDGPTVNLVDLGYSTPIVMPPPVTPGPMNEDGSELIVESSDSTLLPPGVDTNAVADVYVVRLDAFLDQDADGLDDRWEAATGLSYASAAGADGPDGDPDGDGVINLRERAANSHPRGSDVRYFAEGAENAFFTTSLAFVNPGTTAATAVVRLLGENGETTASFVPVPAHGQRTFQLSDAAMLPAASFSMVVESDAPLAVERTMSWTATSGYGGHAERALPALSTTWFLAEGSTTGEFSLFYLLANPSDTHATATVRYLRPAGLPPIERTYELPPASRTTIPVATQAQELMSTDVSAMITADHPILVERSMYLTRAGQAFAAGHASAGVTAAATTWYFAEGATGGFFDMFLLIANPTRSAAIVEARYLLTDGQVFTKSYPVDADSRLTIWVNGEEFPGRGRVLANVDVSTVLTSTNGIPFVAERAMWFPGVASTPTFWTEAHVSSGETMTAARWAVADVVEGGPANVQTFVLVANTSSLDGRIQILGIQDGRTAYLYEGVLAANSRLTLPIRSALDRFGEDVSDRTSGRRFGLIVESLGPGPLPPLVVERSTYWDAGGMVWAAGVNTLATPIP